MNDAIDVVEVNGVYKSVEEMTAMDKLTTKVVGVKNNLLKKISNNKINIAVSMLATVVALRRNKLI